LIKKHEVIAAGVTSIDGAITFCSDADTDRDLWLFLQSRLTVRPRGADPA
jgi:hypothetical protein